MAELAGIVAGVEHSTAALDEWIHKMREQTVACDGANPKSLVGACVLRGCADEAAVTLDGAS
jgi:hypothetical protein